MNRREVWKERRKHKKEGAAKLHLTNALAHGQHAPAQRVVLFLLREGALHAKDEKIHVQEQGELFVDVWSEQTTKREAAR